MVLKIIDNRPREIQDSDFGELGLEGALRHESIRIINHLNNPTGIKRGRNYKMQRPAFFIKPLK